MSDSDDRRAIQPEDWPLEEGGAQAQDGLRSDVGLSQETPKTESSDDEVGEGAGTADDGGRGPLGTATPTTKGAEQGPR